MPGKHLLLALGSTMEWPISAEIFAVRGGDRSFTPACVPYEVVNVGSACARPAAHWGRHRADCRS